MVNIMLTELRVLIIRLLFEKELKTTILKILYTYYAQL